MHFVRVRIVRIASEERLALASDEALPPGFNMVRYFGALRLI